MLVDLFIVHSVLWPGRHCYFRRYHRPSTWSVKVQPSYLAPLQVRVGFRITNLSECLDFIRQAEAKHKYVRLETI